MTAAASASIPGLHDERVSDFGALVEAHARLSRRFDASLRQRCGLPLAWFEVLLRLGRSPEEQLTMGALAEQIALTSGGATRLVDRIEQGGLIERRPCPTDRRVQYVGLTAAGAGKLADALEVHIADLEDAFVAPLSPTERTVLPGALRRLGAPDGAPD